ncbi:MAG: hypothetical protein ACOY42_11385 [Pseudomonadota bacterium]
MIGRIRHRLRRTAPLLGAALLIALLAANQVAASLHDADHPFHGHQTLCDVFLGAGLQTPIAAATVATALAAPRIPFAADLYRWLPRARQPTPQQPRAPPVSFPTI